MTFTLHKSQVHFLVSRCLRFTNVRSFVCTGRLRNLRADCSTVVLYCVTITWPKLVKGSLQVTVVDVLAHVARASTAQTSWQVMQQDSGWWQREDT